MSLLLLAATVYAVPVPALAQSPSLVTVEDVLALASVSSPEMSPDGSRIAYVVTRADFDRNENDSDVWVVATAGDAPVRLTFHSGADGTPQWAPDGKLLFFLSDREDGGKQVFAIRPDGGEAFPVTAWERGIESFRVSPDGARLAFVAKPKKTDTQEAFEEERGRPEVWDAYYDDEWSRLWVAPLEDGRAGEAKLWSPTGHNVTSVVWSPDSKDVAYGARPTPALRTNREAAVFLADGEGGGGDTREVSDMPGGERPVAWTEERGLIVSGSGQPLGTYNSRLWSVSPLASLTDALDEHAGYVTSDSESLLLEASRGTGRGLVRLSGGEVTAVSDDARYYAGFSASRDGTKLAFLGESGNEPPDVYFADLASGSWAPERLTDMNPDVRDYALGEQRVVQWMSRADGEPIEGVLTLPVDHREGDAAPMLLVIHGGPSGVSSARFSPRRGAYAIQVFAGLGYAVLEPNYRGSTGYGERFRGLNRGEISGKDWIDIDSGVDAMVERGIADPDRLGIMGWSFGGHHTYWGITQTDRFKAASAGAGANDLISMYSQTDLPEFYVTYLGPRPWEDFELYEERSAYRNVAKVSTPLLIQVGENDERVPAEQSIQFYEAVRTLGKVETELVVYPGQPHGVSEPRLVRDLLIRNVEWFSRFVPATSRSNGHGDAKRAGGEGGAMRSGKLLVAASAAVLSTVSSIRVQASEVTFTRDVMPILARNCLECHRSGQIAPMAFTSYEETRPWAESIKEAVSRREMPPWHADPNHGVFENERRLSDAEIATLVAWADAGAPRGDRADLPPPPSYVEGWSIGRPDGVYAMTESYRVAPEGSDEYIYFRVPLDFEEERFVSAVEVMPGNRAVVHHVLVYVQPKTLGDVSRTDTDRYNEAVGEELFYGDGDMIRVRGEAPVHDDGCVLPNGGSALSGDVTGGRRAMLAAFAPGSRGDIWPEGTARRIPAGSEILLQIHYNKTGRMEEDRTSVGLVFSDGPPEKVVRGRWVQNYYFEIPAGATHHEVKGCYQFDRDVHLLSYFPHMHLRGKDMEMTAIFPSGETRVLLRVPRYDFNWQHTYILETPIAIPEGTRILVTAHYDNSKRNDFNPDPSKSVRWGDPTYDEMMIGGMNYTIDDENLQRNATEPN